MGGLVYRVSRSRMYVSAYRDRIQDFRIIRIEGWQPYDEFVRRHCSKISTMSAALENVSIRCHDALIVSIRKLKPSAWEST